MLVNTGANNPRCRPHVDRPHNGPTPSERHEHSRWFSDLKEQLLQRVAPAARRPHSRT